MDSKKWHTINSILDRVIDLPEEERTAAIQAETENDPELFEEIMRLFEADIRASDMLEEGVGAFVTQDQQHPNLFENLGWKEPALDRYKIIEELGTGGMSIVYLAERTDGVFDKQVAIKVMKPFGLNRKQRARRLEDERQILAKLQHPNIATVLDGGLTEDGWPYLVMEWVRGLPITRYCLENKLSLENRLKLFGQVCKAMYYAHQQLIVHRDLKPANILVTNTGEVKLLDFGIAKMLREQDGTSALTRTGRFMLTPEYAAPEQLRGDAASTSEDVYSLGVLLYELLTGTRPFDLSGKTPAEIENLVCEQEPVRPSEKTNQTKRPVRFSSKKSGSDTLTFNQSTGNLTGLTSDRLKGDLDVICLKALRKDPEQRYGSVQELHEDILRYLRGEPVTARPATRGYRVRKFIQRHQTGVFLTTFILILLTGFMITLLKQHSSTLLERDRAVTEAHKAEQITGFLLELFENANPLVTQERDVTAEELLQLGRQRAELLSDQPEVTAQMLHTIGTAFYAMGRMDEAYSAFHNQTEILKENFGNTHPEVASGINELGWIRLVQGDYSGAIDLFQNALNLLHRHENEKNRDIAKSLHGLGLALNGEGQSASAEELLRESIDIRQQLYDNGHPDLAHAINDLGIIQRAQGNSAGAEQSFREAITMRKNLFGPSHPLVADSYKHLAGIVRSSGNHTEAEKIMNDVLEIQLAVLGEIHPDVSISYYSLAEILKESGRIQDAFIYNRKAIEIMQNLETPFHMYSNMLRLEAELFQITGNLTEAESSYVQAAQNCSDVHGIHSYSCTRINMVVGEFYFEQQKFEEASHYLAQAHNVIQSLFGPDHEQLREVNELLGHIAEETNIAPQ